MNYREQLIRQRLIKEGKIKPEPKQVGAHPRAIAQRQREFIRTKPQ